MKNVSVEKMTEIKRVGVIGKVTIITRGSGDDGARLVVDCGGGEERVGHKKEIAV